MDVTTLKSKIKQNKIPSFLIFAGDEWEVQKIFINQILKVTDKEQKRIDSISDVYSVLKNRSFVSKSYCYIVRDDKTFMESEKLQEQIQTGLLKDNIYILLLSSVDKRTKFYKKFEKDLVIFEPMTEQTLIKYIQKQIDLSTQNAKKLIEVCESNYGRILLEIDKIKRYRNYGQFDDSPKIYDYCFNELLLDGTIYQPPKDAIFDFVNAILDRKVKKSFQLYQECLDVGEAVMVMLTVLYSNAKAVLQVQTYTGNKLSEGTGLTGWQIKNAKEHLNKYDDEELIYLLQLIKKCDNGIKTGKIEEQMVMPYIMINIL